VRAVAAVVILAAWSAGFSMLVRREFFVGSRQRLAEAALRISPGAVFYIVEQAGKQVGFASTTIDTMPTGIDIVDYFIADLPVAGSTRRASARSVVRLSRALTLRTFDLQAEVPGAPRRVGGRADGDSAIVYAVTSSGQPADSQRVRVPGPMLLPTLVPLALALGETPRVGHSYTLPIFNPATTAPGPVRFTIRAESLFTLVDSVSLDSVRGEWVSAHTDTVRAWRVEPSAASGIGDFSGWVDAAGRIVEREGPRAMTIRRMAYEIAFENWRIARDRVTTASSAGGEREVFERTVVSTGALPLRSLAALTVRLGPADLGGYDLAGGRQTLTGDTLRVRQESSADGGANWSLLRHVHATRARFRADLREEPLLQVHDPRIVRLAVRIAGLARDPTLIAEKINQWVHDSIANRATFSVPNALEVLRTRKGDCNEHTQLAVALARALGIPARAATGLAYVNGRFYYHAWPEVYLRDWVAMDPTFGQFPADASHLRFMAGSLARQTDFLRLLGTLHITVVEAR
jgi:hypothetical protein